MSSKVELHSILISGAIIILLLAFLEILAGTLVSIGTFSVSVLFALLIIQGCLNSTQSGFVLTKGEVRRSLAVSITVFYILTVSNFISRGYAVDRILDGLNYVVMSVFGFYFGFRVLDNWLRYRSLREVLTSDKIKDKIVDENLKEIVYEVLNVRK